MSELAITKVGIWIATPADESGFETDLLEDSHNARAVNQPINIRRYPPADVH